MAGISSLVTALIGLPQFSASSAARSAALASIASAIASSLAERSAKVVRDQRAKAARAAATARSIWLDSASATPMIASPVRGFSTVSAGPVPASKAPPISRLVSISVSLFLSVICPVRRRCPCRG